MTRNPDPIRITPSANFAGAEGLRLRRASAIHIQAKNGAKMMMKAEFSDWNQPVGITKCERAKHAIRVALGEQIQGRTGLLVAGRRTMRSR